MYVDSHIHLQDYKTHNVKNVVTNAIKNEVMHFINPSAHPSDWANVAALAAQYPQITPAFGIHPWYIAAASPDWAQELEQYLQNNPSAMVGECGIDKLKNPDTESQINILKAQINLAHKYNRPLIIHAVKADSELRDLFPALPSRTIFHSFTGSAEWGKAIQKHGFYLGLNFSILRKKNAAEILRELDLNQILLETDGPYQNFEKGVETLPQNLPQLAADIAGLLQIPPAEFAQTICKNQNEFLGEK
jgi:TatD DNase family protein